MPQRFLYMKDLLPRIVLISIDHNFYDANCQKKLTFSDRPPLCPLATLFVKTIMVANLEAVVNVKVIKRPRNLLPKSKDEFMLAADSLAS